jgi:protein-tyrosine phosphatase
MTETLRLKRRLDLEGTYNVRDVGGYRTQDGRRTRWRTFLRADSLHRLSDVSKATLIEYGVRTVIDLRTDSGARSAPSAFAGSSDVEFHHQDMIGDAPRAEESEPSAPQGRPQRIRASYKRILDRRQPQICETLATLAAPGGLPALVHCGIGKDRTGLITALVLGIAGVPEETIAEDYALSARFLLERYFVDGVPTGAAPSGFIADTYLRESSPPEAMLGTLQHLRERYDGVEGYAQAIGLRRGQIDGLRDALVE